MNNKEEIKKLLKFFESKSNTHNLEGMQRFGIRFKKAYGVNIPMLRKMAKEYKPNHKLALELWGTGIHECMILAFLIDNPAEVTKSQMQKWVNQFASWDICDGCCCNLFDKTPYAYEKSIEWTSSNKEYVKRAGFVIMAALAVHDKKADDEFFMEFFLIIEREANDDRNFVKKAVNWVLRQIGKRNYFLFNEAIKVAKRIEAQESKSAKWIAKDALREFESKKEIMKNKN
jgi:3-methyladenine DNA glycosylase AlkD